MAKRYFRKKNKIKKGSDLPPGMRRMKGLARDATPIFRSPIDMKEAQRLVHISNHVVEDPSVMSMRVLRDDDLDRKLDELIPDEDD